jgi:hypothetical protein
MLHALWGAFFSFSFPNGGRISTLSAEGVFPSTMIVFFLFELYRGGRTVNKGGKREVCVCVCVWRTTERTISLEEEKNNTIKKTKLKFFTLHSSIFVQYCISDDCRLAFYTRACDDGRRDWVSLFDSSKMVYTKKGLAGVTGVGR